MIRRLVCLVVLSSAVMVAQSTAILQNPSHAPLRVDSGGKVSAIAAEDLPSAPVPQMSLDAQNSSPQSQPSPSTSAPAAGAAPAGAIPLSIKDAEQLALKNNPQISVARLTALASQQVTRETRSALWPTAVADMTGVDSHANSRIAAGGLNNPVIYQRAAVGATVTQLITDFGRTTNLVSSANFAAKAQDENSIATQEQILLAVDQAFYGALQAHSITRVAEQTVSARQTVADQIEALFKSKLKSELDLSFANVNLSQAKLLLLDAQSNENAALAALSAILGYATPDFPTGRRH